MTHGTRVRYVLGWSLLASLPVLHCEELSIPREYEGRLIQAVRFEPPLQPLTRAYLARLLPFQPGAAASGRYPRCYQATLQDRGVSEYRGRLGAVPKWNRARVPYGRAMVRGPGRGAR